MTDSDECSLSRTKKGKRQHKGAQSRCGNQEGLPGGNGINPEKTTGGKEEGGCVGGSSVWGRRNRRLLILPTFSALTSRF